jgi:hypothetical protein
MLAAAACPAALCADRKDSARSDSDLALPYRWAPDQSVLSEGRYLGAVTVVAWFGNSVCPSFAFHQ